MVASAPGRRQPVPATLLFRSFAVSAKAVVTYIDVYALRDNHQHVPVDRTPVLSGQYL
jgi:hypothetical protein